MDSMHRIFLSRAMASLLSCWLAGCGGEAQIPVAAEREIEALRAMPPELANMQTFALGLGLDTFTAAALRDAASPALARRLWDEYLHAGAEPHRYRWLYVIGSIGSASVALLPELGRLAADDAAARSALRAILVQTEPDAVPAAWREFGVLARRVARLRGPDPRAVAPDLAARVGAALRDPDPVRRQLAWGLLPDYERPCDAPLWDESWRPALDDELARPGAPECGAAWLLALQIERGARSALAARWLEDPDRAGVVLRWLASFGWLKLSPARADAVWRELAAQRPVLDRALDAAVADERAGLFLLYFRLGRGVDLDDVFARALDDDELAPLALLTAPMIDLHVPGLRSAALRIAGDPDAERSRSAVAWLARHAAGDRAATAALARAVGGPDRGARSLADDLLSVRPVHARAVFDAYVARVAAGVDVGAAMGPLLAASFAGAALGDAPGVAAAARAVSDDGASIATRLTAAAVLGRIALVHGDRTAARDAAALWDAVDGVLDPWSFAFEDHEDERVAMLFEVRFGLFDLLDDAAGADAMTEALRVAVRAGPDPDPFEWPLRAQIARAALCGWRRERLGD